jgi:hypothetical protein
VETLFITERAVKPKEIMQPKRELSKKEFGENKDENKTSNLKKVEEIFHSEKISKPSSAKGLLNTGELRSAGGSTNVSVISISIIPPATELSEGEISSDEGKFKIRITK